MSEMMWDRIRIRPPVCYLPPIWEIVLNRNVDIELAKNITATVPDTAPAMIEKHLNERIRIVKTLIDTKKLDSRIGKVAIDHFQAHLEELKGIRA